jgi:hypothetical protein
MAKKQKKKPSKRPAVETREGLVSDASHLAAIRWYVLVLEKRAIELVVTDPTSLEDVNRALSECWDTLRSLTPSSVESAGGCPPGFQLCDDICQPECPPGGIR